MLIRRGPARGPRGLRRAVVAHTLLRTTARAKCVPQTLVRARLTPRVPPPPDATRMKNVPLISLSWDEGRICDLWMTVHFLSGLSGGLSNIWFGFAPPTLYLIALGTMILWELAEYAKGIRETTENRVIDVGIGLAGVYVARAITPLIPPDAAPLAFAASVVLGTVACVFGWRAYRRRTRAPRGASVDAPLHRP